MRLEDQVCSIELSKRLKELGVKQLSLCYWWQYDKDSWDLTINVYPTNPNNYISAFTVAELGEMLPEEIQEYNLIIQKEYGNTWKIFYEQGIYPRDTTLFCVNNETEANARAKMLIHLLENKLMSI